MRQKRVASGRDRDMSSTRIWACGFIVTGLLCISAVGAAQTSSCPAGRTPVTGNPGWIRIPSPTFPPPREVQPVYSDPQSKESDLLAVDGLAGNMYVSDGESVLRSKDRGCSWELVLASWQIPNELRDPTALKPIKQLLIGGSNSVLVLLKADSAQEKILRSSDGGETWASVGPQTLPKRINSVHPSQMDADVIYVRAGPPLWIQNLPETQTHSLYTTEDGGKSWREGGSLPSEVFGGSLTLDPRDHKSLWLHKGSIVMHSRDMGVTWARVQGIPEDALVRQIVFHPTKSWSLLVTDKGVLVSKDDGLSFTSPGGASVPATEGKDHSIESAAFGSRRNDILVLTFPMQLGSGEDSPIASKLFRLDSRGYRWVDLTPFLWLTTTTTGPYKVLASTLLVPGPGQYFMNSKKDLWEYRS